MALMSSLDKTGACDVYNTQECKHISPGCNGSVSNRVGSAAATWSPVGVLLFSLGDETAILDGNLLVKYRSVVYIEVLSSFYISTSGGLSVNGGSRCILKGLSGSKVLYMSLFASGPILRYTQS